MKAMRIEELKTPAFLVDLPKLKTNIRNMHAGARRHGVRLRPHVKTHKTAEIARLQIPDEACGITVSTLAVALFPRYHVIEGNQVVDEWRPMRGW
ncbi:MAG: hypothetical protein V2I56_22015 [Desulfobacteraceae bacterium]|jgi:D-serine deaminase-like pyridoxal phosphate-dependent protein|nr:hypothetical protein [Desulfobacteraceae bacterium]